MRRYLLFGFIITFTIIGLIVSMCQTEPNYRDDFLLNNNDNTNPTDQTDNSSSVVSSSSQTTDTTNTAPTTTNTAPTTTNTAPTTTNTAPTTTNTAPTTTNTAPTTTNTTEGDTVSPQTPTNFQANSNPEGNEIILNWVNPPDPDFDGVLIRFSIDDYPTDINDGNLLVNVPIWQNPNSTHIASGLVDNVTYYFMIFAFDQSKNYSDGVKASGTPKDINPPDTIDKLNYTIEKVNAGIKVCWDPMIGKNDDWTWIRFEIRSNTYPTHYHGQSGANSGNYGYIDNGNCYGDAYTTISPTSSPNNCAVLDTNNEDCGGVNFYISMWVKDEVPNYSKKFDFRAYKSLRTPYDIYKRPGANKVYMRFTKGKSSYQDGVRIVRNTGANPAIDSNGNVTIGTLVYDYPTPTMNAYRDRNHRAYYYIDEGLTAGTTYYYGLYSYDNNANLWSDGAYFTETPFDAAGKSQYHLYEEDFEDPSYTPQYCDAHPDWKCWDSNTANGTEEFWGIEIDPNWTMSGIGGSKFLASASSSNCGGGYPNYNAFNRANAKFRIEPGGANWDLTNYTRMIVSFNGRERNDRSDFYLRVKGKGYYNYLTVFNYDAYYYDNNWHWYWVDMSSSCGATDVPIEFEYITYNGSSDCAYVYGGLTLDNIKLEMWKD